MAIGTLGLLWYAVRQDGTAKATTEMSKINDRLKPIEDELARHEAHHGKHFAATGINTTAIASLNQQITDHEKHDEERFARIEAMHEEIRTDIKELLRRS